MLAGGVVSPSIPAFGRKDETMKTMIKRLWRDECGASAIEYGLVAALIAVVIAGTATTIGTRLGTMFSNILAALPT
jgi:pilus assembly protein Flp/PilA